MDKLKKRIFIILLLLLAAGLAGLGILLAQLHPSQTQKTASSVTVQDENPETSPAKQAKTEPVPDTAQNADSGTAHLSKTELSRLEMEEWAIHAHDTLERAKAPRQKNTQQQETEPAPSWTNMPCEKAILPPDSPQNLLCRLGDAGFCAFYENGRPYFCRTKNAQTRYQLNPWGSSITVTHKTPLGQPRLELYYADGKLTRTTDYDGKNNLITKTWFDGKNSFRLTQTDNNGRVLDKYYFTPGKPYMRYPDGNDLAATEGPWELKDGQIFTDGQPLYTLPEQTPAPDVCRIFAGACPSPDELPKRTTPGTLIPPNTR